ncbi:hypothetical protein E3N88_24633 [Mikania micrantha]|uniref:Uncharacterized protein n=1 Tax=Mikania micrantha TaxID=192012 RepID=A0A5N6N2E8_9ASTR|nr:hypothetical protein E3N88_24633 [Mikania micrantha]
MPVDYVEEDNGDGTVAEVIAVTVVPTGLHLCEYAVEEEGLQKGFWQKFEHETLNYKSYPVRVGLNPQPDNPTHSTT